MAGTRADATGDAGAREVAGLDQNNNYILTGEISSLSEQSWMPGRKTLYVESSPSTGLQACPYLHAQEHHIRICFGGYCNGTVSRGPPTEMARAVRTPPRNLNKDTLSTSESWQRDSHRKSFRQSFFESTPSVLGTTGCRLLFPLASQKSPSTPVSLPSPDSTRLSSPTITTNVFQCWRSRISPMSGVIMRL